MDVIDRYKQWRICLYNGWFFLGVMAVFWALFAQSVPPFAPTTDASVIAAFIRDNAVLLKLGMLGGITFSGCYLVWGIGISKVMETVEGEGGVLATIQLWGAGITAVIYLLAFAILLCAAYRPAALDPALLQFLYDSSWIVLMVPLSSVLMQYIAISLVFLRDKRDIPLIPRWVCWYNIWMAFASFGEELMPFAMTGPFSRNGIIGFWFEANIYFLWMILMTVYCLKAIKVLEGEAKRRLLNS